ncbi:TPA: hypothetical protein DEP21_04235 [Patescibacteria group bacterium]|nr:hypothetical protein [Candidatus Gracilibacteria bacterium]
MSFEVLVVAQQQKAYFTLQKVTGIVQSFPDRIPLEGVKLKINKKILFLTFYKTFAYTASDGSFSFEVSASPYGRIPGRVAVKFCKRKYHRVLLEVNRPNDHLIIMQDNTFKQD